jgi:hypothetical protein
MGAERFRETGTASFPVSPAKSREDYARRRGASRLSRYTDLNLNTMNYRLPGRLLLLALVTLSLVLFPPPSAFGAVLPGATQHRISPRGANIPVTHLEAISRHCTSDAQCEAGETCHPFLDDVLSNEVYDTRCVTADPWRKAWMFCLSARVQDTWPIYVMSHEDYVHCEKKMVVRCPSGTKIVQRNGDPFCKELWL